ncbi:transcriptional regulator GcvA [Thalassomonas sp. M1454]|uniref:transcriptional regulator GcvA n=1 Tax=Thalassomonas sp. M1454 TaxID=2594477 RepID=UPI001180F560|nr:transcriptional regulator GcvA [Thalassomonas sp. M1454]TRX57077.1 transcriptional regulator GcvA [Thalassomonas sp. M1454]
MSKRLPPLNSLKAFEVSARLLSFTKAADELFVTQAAVSHQIKLLENHLGLKLFMRKNRTLLLTEEGQSYYLDIKDIFNSLQESTQRLLAKRAKGTITVCIQPSLAIQWLVPRLNEFNKLNPDIEVRIKADDRNDGTLADDVDIAFYYGHGHWPGIIADKVIAEYLQPVCSPILLSSENAVTDIASLQQHTLLHDTSRNDWKRWFKLVGIKSSKVDQGPLFSHSAIVLQAAVHGQGVALVNNILAKPEIDAGRLIAPFNKVLVNQDGFYLVCRDNQLDMARIAPFRNWVLETVKNEGDDILDAQ